MTGNTEESKEEAPRLVNNLISPIFNQGLIGFGAGTSSHNLDDSNSSIEYGVQGQQTPPLHQFPGLSANINLGNFRFADILGSDDISYINPMGINHQANKTQTSIIVSASSQRKGTEEKSSSGGFERLEDSAYSYEGSGDA